MNRSGGTPPVIVIGAGIVGAATAAFLAKAGVPVRLLEAVAPAAGATGAADGAVSVATKRPGPLMELARAGVALYRDLAQQGLLAGEFEARPTFLSAATLAEAEVLDRHAAALGAAGVPLVWHDAAAARQRIPGLAAGTAALLEVGDEGHASGFRVVDRLLSAAGLVVERRQPVQALCFDGPEGAVSAVRLADEVLPASAVVVAAGAGSGDLLGFAPLMRPRKGQQLVTERAPHLRLPGSVISASYLLSKGAQAGARDARGYGIVIDAQATGQFLIGSTREEGVTDRGNDLAAVAHMARAAAAVLPGLADLRVIRCFAGVRTAMADGLPVIGRMPGHPNLYVATGFEGDGICLGPLTGRLIAQMVQGIRPAINLDAFDPARLAALPVAA